MKLLSVLILFVFASVNHCSAWGYKGHRIISENAVALLTPEKRARLNEILASADLSCSNSKVTVENPLTLMDASVWMDRVRKYYPEWSYMNDYHFYNFDNNNDANVVAAISNAITKLNVGQSNNKDTKLYILQLLHLVGDIHQPLHCGNYSDLGGNKSMVSCDTCREPSTNMHHLWDDEFITQYSITAKKLIIKVKAYSDNIFQPMAWATESYNIVSASGFYPQNGIADSKYLNSYKPVVEDQLIKASYRLYKILDSVL